jgi:hypothetical protein
LARYAVDAPEKSDIENKLEAAMGDKASRRAVAQRLVDNFRKIPLQTRANIFGSLATPSKDPIPQQRLETVFRKLQKKSVPPIIFDDVQPPDVPIIGAKDTFTLNFCGIYCAEETSDQGGFFGASDEIYIITTVVEVRNGLNIEVYTPDILPFIHVDYSKSAP